MAKKVKKAMKRTAKKAAKKVAKKAAKKTAKKKTAAKKRSSTTKKAAKATTTLAKKAAPKRAAADRKRPTNEKHFTPETDEDEMNAATEETTKRSGSGFSGLNTDGLLRDAGVPGRIDNTTGRGHIDKIGSSRNGSAVYRANSGRSLNARSHPTTRNVSSAKGARLAKTGRDS